MFKQHLRWAPHPAKCPLKVKLHFVIHQKLQKMKNNEILVKALNADAHLAHNGKNQRIAAIHEYLELPKFHIFTF